MGSVLAPQMIENYRMLHIESCYFFLKKVILSTSKYQKHAMLNEFIWYIKCKFKKMNTNMIIS